MSWIKVVCCVLLCAGFAARQDVDVPPPAAVASDEQSFSQVEISPGVWEVRCRSGSDFDSSLAQWGVVAHLSQITVDAGNTYYSASPPREVADDILACRVQMWAEPPEGAHVFKWDVASTQVDLESVQLLVFHAPSFIKTRDPSRSPTNRLRERKRAEELLATRDVKVESVGFRRRRFAEEARFGAVSGLAFDARSSKWPASLFVAEPTRFSWVTANGTLVQRNQVEGSSPTSRGFGALQVFRAPDDQAGVLSSPSGWAAVTAYSAAGEILWSWKRLPFNGQNHAPNHAAAGDLDGDGVDEFVIGTNGGGGVFFLDDHGRLDHRVPGSNVFSVAVVDMAGDEQPEVVHTAERGLAVLDASGDELPDVVRPVDTRSEFRIVSGPDGSALVLSVEWELPLTLAPALAPRSFKDVTRSLLLTKLDGTEVRRVPLPDAQSAGVPHIAWLREFEDSEPLLAVTCSGADFRCQLLVFDPDDEVVHHELIGAVETINLPILTLPQDDGRDALLIGARDGLWLYEFP